MPSDSLPAPALPLPPLLQGIVGTTPWLALVFLTLYLQLLGFSDFAASLLLACFLGANALGGLVGGAFGDAAARQWPNHGRIAVCQLSVGLGVPLSALLFKASAGLGGVRSKALGRRTRHPCIPPMLACMVLTRPLTPLCARSCRAYRASPRLQLPRCTCSS